LVIQSDAFNLSRINTVLVAAITSNLRFEAMPGNVRLAKGEAGIPKSSVVNISQLHAIDRSFIDSRIGTITNEKLKLVKTGLRAILDIGQ
jgi:mRNA interferase MazF